MAYNHGVRILENPTSLTAPILGTAAFQVVVGVSPVNLAEDPYKATNVVKLAYSFPEASAAVGYSNNLKDYNLNQSISATFKKFAVAPIALINVLDPKKHKDSIPKTTCQVGDLQATVSIEGSEEDVLMEKDKNLTQVNQVAEAEAAAVEARKKQEMDDNPFLVFFKKPFTFEGVSYESVDLSGLESLSAADMIAVNKTIERGGTVNVFSYTDPASGESDTASITLTNIDMRWANSWMPKKGDKFTAKIIEKSWDKAGKKKSYYCGKFCLDDLSYTGPELTCTIGGVSVPDSNAFRSTTRSKTWKKITLRELASGIAKKYHMKLSYIGSTIRIGSIEQSNETDSGFLKKVCEDYGMAIKIYCGKIVIYDKGRFEARKPVVTLNKADLQEWSYNSTLTGTYTGARIRYTSGKNSKEMRCVVGGGKRIFNINEKVDSLQEARLKACAKVNVENEKAVTMNVTIKANSKIAAGSTIRIKGLYHLSGKYFIDKVVHNVGQDAYTMNLELHKCQKRISAQKKKKR